MAGPAPRNIVFTKGDTYRHKLGPLCDDSGVRDVSGSTFEAHVREDPTATGTAEAEFALDTLHPDHDPVNGVIVLILSATATDGLAPATEYRWDVQETEAGGDVVTLIQGDVEVKQDVTHS